LSSYADTSFLISLYTLDGNSVAATTRMRVAELPFVLTSLGELELTNALELRVFRKELDRRHVEIAQREFRRDIDEGIFSLKPLAEVVYERARRMARRRSAQLGTRTLDILHIASAMASGANAFYTFDKKQQRLAAAEGLQIA
jgi:predicted nucleic acid-binding protein